MHYDYFMIFAKISRIARHGIKSGIDHFIFLGLQNICNYSWVIVIKMYGKRHSVVRAPPAGARRAGAVRERNLLEPLGELSAYLRHLHQMGLRHVGVYQQHCSGSYNLQSCDEVEHLYQQ